VPGDDGPLAGWVRGQPGIGAVRVQRQPLRGAQGETVRISTRFVGPEGVAKPDVPWQRLGYRPGTAVPEPWWTRMAPSVAFNPTDAQLVLLCLGALQAGMLLVGFLRLWRN